MRASMKANRWDAFNLGDDQKLYTSATMQARWTQHRDHWLKVSSTHAAIECVFQEKNMECDARGKFKQGSIPVDIDDMERRMVKRTMKSV